MGNRATVIFTDGKQQISPAIYLHWNGGPESIYGFLEELDRRRIRADQDCEAARFIQLVGEFFDQSSPSGLSLGVANGPAEITVEALEAVQTDHGDNGFYIVNRTVTPLQMRRVVEDWTGSASALKEWSPQQVAEEQQEADKSAYRVEFRMFFARKEGERR